MVVWYDLRVGKKTEEFGIFLWNTFNKVSRVYGALGECNGVVGAFGWPVPGIGLPNGDLLGCPNLSITLDSNVGDMPCSS